MTYVYFFVNCLIRGLLLITAACFIVIVRFYLSNGAQKLDQCFLYMGKVGHTRLKGGATHHFVYPLFFSFIDLEQIQNIGWLLWPIFKLNGGRYTFCSLDEKDHLQDWVKEQSDIQNKNNTSSDLKNTRSTSLLQRAYSFIEHRTKGARKLSEGGSIRLMAHLTYFGYCFNPISVFYCLRPEMRTGPQAIREKSDCCHEQNATANDTSSISATLSGISAADLLRSAAAAVDAAPISTGESKSSIESIIVEVSNTPWIEQHSYMLDESIPNVSITRDYPSKGQTGSFKATWLKEFHVSPFMEMDYKYNFTFSEPKESVWVQSTMTKLSTNEVWFNVNFELNRIPFTPLNLLYVLLYYPLYTRMIQVLIHYEAVKLFLKGVPTFNHPKGTPVEFGFGLTDKKLIVFVGHVNKLINRIFGKGDVVKAEKVE